MITLLLTTGSLTAQDLEHTPLTRSDKLGFDELLELALMQSPAFREIAARELEAQSHQAVGDSWIAGRPSVQLDYLDDRSLSNLGQTELNYGIHMPLWRLGEKQDMQTLGQRYTEQSTAWVQAFRLETAGKLRSSLADLEDATAMLALEQQATSDAQDLLQIVQTLYASGEVAQLEVLQARSLLLTQRRNELEADALHVDAERTYSVLTGLHVAPATAHTETLSTQDEIPPSHPQLYSLQRDIDLQDANITKAEHGAKGNPSLSLGSRRQKDGPRAGYSDALTLSLSIPFGGQSFISAAASSARRAKVDAEVAYFSVLRELNGQLHEVEHTLYTIGLELPLLEEEAGLARQQWEMARTAFELGETDMSRVVLAMQLARNSEKAYRMLALRQERLITEFNQIIGELP